MKPAHRTEFLTVPSIASAEAWMLIAHIRILTRRLARYHVY